MSTDKCFVDTEEEAEGKTILRINGNNKSTRHNNPEEFSSCKKLKSCNYFPDS
jgi:hypothetical protein